MATAATMASATGRSLLAYGVLGFPLAFAALPLYVHVPRLYAEDVGLSLALVGGVLLAARLLDAVADPLIGAWSDRWSRRRGDRRGLILLALPLLAAGLLGLLAPPAGAGILWLAAMLTLTFAGFSLASINYHAWGAEVHVDTRQRALVTAWREGFALAGVVVAAALPALLADEAAPGLQRLAWVFVPALTLAALVTLLGAPAGRAAPAAADTIGALRRDRLFRRLLWVLAVGGIAAAIPATLVLFYIADVLRLAAWQGAFLAIYFLAGALALPGWVALARRRGKVAAWASSMALALASFVWAFFLDAGDAVAFGLICAASGAALGAELALPPAVLADRLARTGAVGPGGGAAVAGAGAYFGLWNFVTKLNLALAAGLALPLLSLAGYKVGATDTAALSALAAVYALLPAALKMLALALLWRWRRDFEGDA
jgi:Na+/melibiose symporter-like transporter